MPTDGPVGESLLIDFDNAELTHSNLGGFGPDTGDENVRFAGVGQWVPSLGDDTITMDLVISEFSSTAGYEPYNTERTMINGKFGQINMGAERSALLQFCWQDSTTGDPVVVDKFGFVFHDFDNGGYVCKERMEVGPLRNPETDCDLETECNEASCQCGMIGYSTSDALDPPVETELSIGTAEVTYGASAGTWVRGESSTIGIGGDNAADPDDLTTLQKKRMFAVDFAQTDCVKMRFAILAPDAEDVTNESPITYGRNFLIVGSTKARSPMTASPSSILPPSWLNAARHGYCERTGGKGDGTCSHGQKGSLSIASSAFADWQSAAKACLDACDACKRCRHISLSLRFADCSWYHDCPSTHVDLPGFRSAPVQTCEHCAKEQAASARAASSARPRQQQCDNPFLPNNTRACFVFPEAMKADWSRRSRALMRADGGRCVRLGDHGVRWNGLGLELPDGSNASAAADLLRPYLEDAASSDQADYNARTVQRDWEISRSERDAAVRAAARRLPALQRAAVAELATLGVARLSHEWNLSLVVRRSGLLEAARDELERRRPAPPSLLPHALRPAQPPSTWP